MFTISIVLQSVFTLKGKVVEKHLFRLKAVIKLCGRITPCVVFIATILFTLQIATRMAIKAGEGTPKIRLLQLGS